MLLRELMEKFDWQSIEKRIIELYPEMNHNLNKFKNVIDNLKKLKAVKPEENITIIVEEFSEIVESEHMTWYEVSGFDPENEYYYGLALMPWEKWLGSEINEKTLDNFSLLDILVHILWEMTYYGFTQKEIDKKKKQSSLPKDSEMDYEIIELENGIQIEIPKILYNKSKKEIEFFVSELKLLAEDEDELLQFLKEKTKRS